MLGVLHLLCALGTLATFLNPVQSGFYDYENEVYDYYRQDSSNQDSVQTSVSYNCKEEGFHEDPNNCRTFYRCVDFGNGPLTPFKFECGEGTVFSKLKGNVCVHPNESERPECCSPANEIDSNEPGDGGWNQPQKPEQPEPGYPSQRPEKPSYPPQKPSYPAQTHRPDPPSYPTQWPQLPTQKPQQPSYPTQKPQQPSYPTQKPQQPSYPTQRPYSPSYQTQRPQYPTQKPPSPSYPPQTQRPQPPTYPPTQETQQPNYTPPTQKPQSPSYPPQPQKPDNLSGCTTAAPGSTGGSACGPAPGCSEEGFYPNPQNCHQFYRCFYDGNRLSRADFTCGPGTAWDQSAQTCNFEYTVASCGSGSGSGNQPHGTDGSSQSTESSIQPPYPPSRPTQSPMQSPYPPSRPTQSSTKPTYPSSLPTQSPTQSPYPSSRPTQNPTQPPYVSSPASDRPTQTVYPGSSTNGPEYIPPQQPSTNVPPSSGGPTEAPGTGGKPCPPTGSSKDCNEEGFFPNPNDCHKFYRCVNEDGSFRKYDFECGSGTAWDQQLQTCNFEQQVAACGGSGGSPGQSPESGSSPSSQQPPSGTPPSPTTPQSSQSTTEPGTGVNQEVSSTSTPQVTQPSTELSPSSTKKPETPSTSQPQKPTTQQQTTSQATQPTMQPPTQQTQQPTSQQPTSQQPQQTTPSTGSSQTSNPPSGSSQSGTCQSEGFFPNPKDCRKFYRCVSNPPGFIKYEFDCGPGTAWDQNLLTCNYIHLVASCEKENEIEPNQSTPDKTSSTVSSSSTPLSTSPSATDLSSTTQPSEENKTDPSKPTPMIDATSSESTSESSSNTESSSTAPSGSSSSEASSKPDCEPPKRNNTIVCNNAGFYPHPTRCDKFYRCVDNGKGFNIYYFDCPPGTIFDPSLDVCNYPESVYPARDCDNAPDQGGTSPSQPSSPTTPASTSAESTTQSSASTTPSSTEGTTGGSSEATTTEPSTEGSLTTEPGSTEGSSEATTPSSETTTSSSEGTTPASSEGTTASSESTTMEGESTITSSTSSETTTAASSEATTTAASSEATTPQASSETTTPMPEESSTTSSTSPESTTDTQESTTMASSEKPPSVDNCPQLANLTDEQIVLVCPTGFRRHPKLCNLFYQCTTSGMEVKILILQCPNGTIYDEKDNKCVTEAESSQPCMGAIAEKRIQRRATENSSPLIEVSRKSLCPEEGHFPYRDGCSNVFYKCKRDSRYALQGYLYKCPKDFMYWSVSRRCERASRLPMCTNMSNETEDENEYWESRWEIPIEDRNLSARSLDYF